MIDETPSIQQACAVPYRPTASGKPEFCLITSAGRGDWIFPKGIVDPGETLETTVLKEAEEEAGLHGKVEGEPLGDYVYHKWGTTLQVTAFLMRVTTEDDDWDEAEFRQRCWCGPSEARELLQRPKLQRLLDAALSRLAAD
ncbi:MAG: NUDIX hydrolase [Pirellulales bacterium]|nr:NUDIX hydrolase [Pirellulales bacterium]